MDVEYAFLAEAAEYAPGGRLHMFGGNLENLHASFFPAANFQVTLVGKLTLRPAECERPHTLVIELRGPDKQRVGDAAITTIISPLNPEDPKRPGAHLFVVKFQNVTLETPGDYIFQITVQKQLLKRIPLYVRLAAGAVGPPTGSNTQAA